MIILYFHDDGAFVVPTAPEVGRLILDLERIDVVPVISEVGVLVDSVVEISFALVS